MSILADIVVLIHVAFVLFVAVGSLLVVHWPRLAWLHVPAVLWAAAVELAGWVCPLTPLEHWLRTGTGAPSYGTSFLEHYVLPILYPAMLTRRDQVVIGVLALVVNAMAYWWILRSYRGSRSRRLGGGGDHRGRGRPSRSGAGP